MINATTNSALTGAGSSCGTPPPPLLTTIPAAAGGGPVSVVQSPLQSPIQSPIQSPVQAPPMTALGSLGGPVIVPSTAGAAALAGVGALGATPIATTPVVTATTTPSITTANPGTSAPSRLTSIAPGGTQGDANLVEATLNILRASASGAALVDRLLAVGAHINVISDAEATAMGHGGAHAFYDPNKDTMYLRRSNLTSTDMPFAAVALAHEGTHLLDDVAQLDNPYIAQISQRIIAAGGPNTASGAEIQRQGQFELTMIKEARAFIFAGQVARDLNVNLPSGDPTIIAARGGNNQSTYNLVWQALLTTSYNPDRRTAPARNF